MNPDVVEAAFWAEYLRNRNVDAGSAGDGALSVAGGYALCVPGTLRAYAIGAGSTRPLRADDLLAVATFYAKRGLVAAYELADDVAARDRDVLEAAGLTHDATRVRAVYSGSAAAPEEEPGSGIVMRTTNDRRAFIAILLRGFADEPQGADARLQRTLALQAAVAQTLVIASIDGEDAGAAAVAVHGDVALLFSAAVLPSARGRGLHAALLAARLRAARGRGATTATLAAERGSRAERTALRFGFTHIHDRLRWEAQAVAAMEPAAAEAATPSS